MRRTRQGNSSRLASSYAVDRPRPRARAAVVMSMTTGSASSSARVRPSFDRPMPSDSRDAILGRAPRQVTQVPHGSQQEREAGRGDQGSEYP